MIAMRNQSRGLQEDKITSSIMLGNHTLEDIVDELSEVVGRYNKAKTDPHTIQVGDYMYRVFPIFRDLQALLRKQKYDILEEELT